jgi:hypothetical protein
MGPEPLEASFGAAALARALTGKRSALKVALLDQRVVAGLGNIYASEALNRAGLSPLRRSSTLATTAGRPAAGAVRLAAAIKTVLREAIAREGRAYRAGRFRVYEREGEPCRTPGCRGTIRRIRQAGRFDVLLSGVSALIARMLDLKIGSRDHGHFRDSRYPGRRNRRPVALVRHPSRHAGGGAATGWR